MTRHQDPEQREPPRSRHPSRSAARRDVEHLLDRLRPEHILPEVTYDHLQRAGREQLLAVRSLIDALINRLDISEPRAHSPQRDAHPTPRAAGRSQTAETEAGDAHQQAPAHHSR